MANSKKKLRVCVTGATGFIGSNLLSQLEKRSDIEVVALSRRVDKAMDGAKKGNVTWRRCNGFCLDEVEEATKNVDILVYLIHSMLPSSALAQGCFSDFDLYLADNFARSAKKNGIKRIIYLSGIIPPDKELSTHLKSRYETEKALSEYGNHLTTLRAGLIVGRNGSSFVILERLIKRLPALICPSWTLSKTQPIDISDVMASIVYAIDHYEKLDAIYDIAGPDVMTYREMLEITAQVLEKKRPIFNVPLFSLSLSKLWVSKVTSTGSSLVYPLVDSLRHDMVADKKKQLVLENHAYVSFRKSLINGIDRRKRGLLHRFMHYNASFSFRWLENVTSIQRIPLGDDPRSCDTAQYYFEWLNRFSPVIKVTTEKDKVFIRLAKRKPLLVMARSIEEAGGRIIFQIIGGMLSRNHSFGGRFEFVPIPSSNCVLVALVNYQPSLPWFIYKYSQAIAHLLVTSSFSRYFSQKRRKSSS